MICKLLGHSCSGWSSPAGPCCWFSFIFILTAPEDPKRTSYPCHLTQTQVVHLLFLVLVITFITLSVASTWTTGEPLGTSGFLPGFENTKSASHVISSGLPGTPLQYSCLENPMDGGAWGAAVHGVAKSRTRLSDFTFTFHFHALEKEIANHSSVLAWRILRMGEPGGLPSMGSHRVGHDWSALAAAIYLLPLTLYVFWF